MPIFGLVFAGWAARKAGMFGPQATIELNRFVVYLALPALLFDIVAHAHLSDVWNVGFVIAFGSSCFAVFAMTAGISFFRRRSLADAAIDGLNAGYSNTGYMGFPLVLAIFGESALSLALIATILTVCVLFGIAIVMIEIAGQPERSTMRVFANVATSLMRNPLILAPVLGALAMAFFGTIASPVEAFLKLLGSSASPCALVALGLFLAESRQTKKANGGTTLLLAATKLVAQPAVALGIAFALRLPAATTDAALLLAALPTGTGPFMLAEMYRCEASLTARTILVTTLISVFTLPLYLHLMGHIGIHR